MVCFVLRQLFQKDYEYIIPIEPIIMAELSVKTVHLHAHIMILKLVLRAGSTRSNEFTRAYHLPLFNELLNPMIMKIRR